MIYRSVYDPICEALIHQSTGFWAAAVLLGMTACSSGAPHAAPPPGALAPGTIDVAIHGQIVSTPRHAGCTRVSTYTTVTAGVGNSRPWEPR